VAAGSPARAAQPSPGDLGESSPPNAPGGFPTHFRVVQVVQVTQVTRRCVKVKVKVGVQPRCSSTCLAPLGTRRWLALSFDTPWLPHGSPPLRPSLRSLAVCRPSPASAGDRCRSGEVPRPRGSLPPGPSGGARPTGVGTLKREQAGDGKPPSAT
jgi:hypothetical protein